jgi:sugar-specific transcriptional regulator TrmB
MATETLMNIEIIKQLNELGLSEKEAALYTTLLKSGAMTVLNLAKISGVKRTTIYNILEALENKGLIYYEIQGSKKLVNATNPAQFNLLIDKQKVLLDTLLPTLLSLQSDNKVSESIIKHYPGLSNIKSVYSLLLDELKNGDEYLVISNQDKWYNLDTVFFESFIKKRAKLNLQTRLLLENTSHARTYQKKQKQYDETIKLLPTDSNIDINLVITKNKTIIVHLTDPIFALVIENKSLVDMIRMLFNLLWAGVRHSS